MKKIRSRICLYMLLHVIIILVVIWLLQVTFLQPLYEHYKAEDVKKIQAQMVNSFREYDADEAYRTIWEMAQENEMYVSIHNSALEPVMTPFMFNSISKFDARFIGPMLNNYQIFLERAVEEMERKDTGDYVYLGEKGEPFIVVVSKIDASNGTFYILSRAPLEPVKATADIIKRNYLMILFIGFFISVLFAFLLSEHISKPIHELSKGAKAVAGGDLTYSVPEENSNSEVSVLIKDFNQMTKELSKVDKIRKDLIANVSHELKTPLTLIKGYAETIKDLTGDNPEKREAQLDVIVDEADRLTFLINDMLDLSKLQAEAVSFNKEEFDLSDVVAKICGRYEYFKDKGYEITVDIEPDVFITADAVKIEQVLVNLMDNAINHSGENPEICVKLSGGPMPRLEISNTGEVISDEDIKYIWDRFYHIDKSGKRRKTGTGIGLSIVREILEIHKFRYGVMSNEEKTTFWVEFN